MKANQTEVNRLTCTQVHIGILLTAIETLKEFLVDQNPESKNSLEGSDRNVLHSAQATFINACNRLDEIIGEKHRWEVTELDEVAKALKEKISMEAEHHRKAKELISERQRPFYQTNATIAATPTGQWIAVGPAQLGNTPVAAVGRSPSEAAANYDAIFMGDRAPDFLPEMDEEEAPKQDQPAAQPVARKPRRKSK